MRVQIKPCKQIKGNSSRRVLSTAMRNTNFFWNNNFQRLRICVNTETSLSRFWKVASSRNTNLSLKFKQALTKLEWILKCYNLSSAFFTVLHVSKTTIKCNQIWWIANERYYIRSFWQLVAFWVTGITASTKEIWIVSTLKTLEIHMVCCLLKC